MGYQIKNRYLIYLFLVSYLLGTFFGCLVHSPISATIIVFNEGMEDNTVGSDLSSINGIWSEHFHSGDLSSGVVTNVNPRTDANSLNISLGTVTDDRARCVLYFNAVIQNLTFWIRCNAANAAASDYQRIYLKDSDNTTLAYLNYDRVDNLNMGLYLSTGTLIAGALTEDVYFNVTFNVTSLTQVNVSVYSAAGVYQGGRLISLSEYSYNWSALGFSTINVGAAASTSCYIDDIRWYTQSGMSVYDVYVQFWDEQTGKPLYYYEDDGDYDHQKYFYGHIMFDSKLATLISSNPYQYRFRTATPVNGFTDIFIYSDSSGDYIEGKYDNEVTRWKTTYTVDIGDYGIFDLYLIRYNDPSCTNWTDEQREHYDDLYGAGSWVEFYNREIPNYYHVGDHAYIVYNFSRANVTTGNTGLFYEIYYGDSHAEGFFVPVSGTYMRGIDYVPFMFFSEGSYYIRLYSYNDTLELKDELIYTSHLLYVGERPAEGAVQTDEFGSYYPIVAFFSLVAIAFALTVLTRHGVVFPTVMFGGLITFSVPGTIFCFFPVWTMFLAGLAILLIVFFYLRHS